VRLSPKLRAVLLQPSLKRPRKLLQRMRRRPPIKDFLEIQKLHWSKILRKIVLVNVGLGCTLTAWYVAADIWFAKTDH
jgi:hypothetical protein